MRLKCLSQFALLICLAGCEQEVQEKDHQVICGVEDPINNLAWLNKEFNALLGGPAINAIVLYEYNGQEVLEVQGSVFSSHNIHQYYCNGDKLNLVIPGAFKEFKEKRKEIKIIYGTKIW